MRILITFGLIAALMGLMLISVEPEVDLSVDQLMESPGEYEGETLRLHGTVESLDRGNQTLILVGETDSISIDYSGTSLTTGADEGKSRACSSRRMHDGTPNQLDGKDFSDSKYG